MRERGRRAEAEAMVAAEARAAAEAGVVACVCRHVRGAHYNALSSRSNFCSLSAISPWIAADSYMALMAAAASGLSWLSDWYCPRIASFWACAGGRTAETGQPWWPALPFLGPTLRQHPYPETTTGICHALAGVCVHVGGSSGRLPSQPRGPARQLWSESLSLSAAVTSTLQRSSHS